MACANSGQQALRELQARGHAWPAGLLALPLPCAGRVGWQLLLKAFELGAAGVLVAACHEGNCRSEDGPARASIAVKQAQASLAALGLPPGRIALASLAGNQPAQLARAIEEILLVLGETR